MVAGATQLQATCTCKLLAFLETAVTGMQHLICWTVRRLCLLQALCVHLAYLLLTNVVFTRQKLILRAAGCLRGICHTLIESLYRPHACGLLTSLRLQLCTNCSSLNLLFAQAACSWFLHRY